MTAYEVYQDFNNFMQMTEFCDGYDNIYNRLKKKNWKNKGSSGYDLKQKN